MTAVSAPSAERHDDRPAPRSAQPLVAPTWLVSIAVPGLILWWALGMASFVRHALILPIALRLLTTRPVRVPPGFGVWLLFLGFVGLSGLQLPAHRLPIFVFNAGEYLAGTAFLLYVFNLPGRDRETLLRIRRSLVHAWYVLVATGWVAIVAPSLRLPSLSQMVLPRSIVSDPWIDVLTTPAVAQVQEFLGYPIPRPSAPFPYTNGWGSAFALLFPFVVATAFTGAPRARRLARIGLVLSVAPAVVSANRTMWASVAAVLVYLVVAARRTPARRALGRAAVVVACTTIALLVTTQLGDVATQRLNTPHSNAARVDLAVEAAELVSASPVLGFGTPQAWEGPGVRPPVGTQGQLWTLLISHGVPAALLFGLFFVTGWRHARGPDLGIWSRAAIVAAAVQLPFYGFLSGQLLLLMVALGAALRESAPASRA